MVSKEGNLLLVCFDHCSKAGLLGKTAVLFTRLYLRSTLFYFEMPFAPLISLHASPYIPFDLANHVH